MKIFVNLIKTIIFLTSIVNGNSEHFISGKIVDEKNNPLIGANIIFKGTSIGSTTDYDGKYIVDNIPLNIGIKCGVKEIFIFFLATFVNS